MLRSDRYLEILGVRKMGVLNGTRGYKLKWKEGFIDLPDIEPGSPVWRSSKDLGLPADVEVTLVTPTGYEVADTMMYQ